MFGYWCKLPFKKEIFVEIRSEWVGFGLIKHKNDCEVFIGRLQLTISNSRDNESERSFPFGRLAVFGSLIFIVLLAHWFPLMQEQEEVADATSAVQLEEILN